MKKHILSVVTILVIGLGISSCSDYLSVERFFKDRQSEEKIFKSYGGNSNNYRPSTYWLRNGSYLRLKNLEIGYNIPKSLINKIHLNNVRLYFMGTNLITFSNFKLWDPELGSTNGQAYPLSRSYTLGLTINI